ncbi:MAG: type II secretion system F family protein [Synechococcus sp. TMED155]|nr:MAG: type II secretion system F family protein [Synechococcus sp. TMED155]
MATQTFLAIYKDRRGKEKNLRLKAADLASAKRNLRQRGIIPVSLSSDSAAGEKVQRGLSLSLEKVPAVKDKAVFASQMAALVSAGVPIVRSLEILAEQQKLPMFKRALLRISKDVNQGSSLGAALRRWPKVFDNLSVAMVEAGEAGGVLEEVLKRLAKLLEDNAKLQNQIRGALGYPVTVLVIAIGVFLGMTIFLIPTFAGIFEDLGAELPAFTQLMVDLSALLRSSFSLLLVGSLLLLVWLLKRAYGTKVGRRRMDGVMLKLPLFGDLIRKTATAQFCRTFSSLTRAGVPILMALDIVRDTVGNRVLSEAIEASKNEVQQGGTLSLALQRRKVFPTMAVSMLVVGEESGGVDAMLSKVADFYEDEIAATVKAMTAMLEPAMIVIVGGIVGSILLAMYLPMFSVFDNIK